MDGGNNAVKRIVFTAIPPQIMVIIGDDFNS